MTQRAPSHQRGIADAVFTAGQQAGSAVGLAVLAAVAAASTARSVRLVTGDELAFVIIAALAAGTVVAISATTRFRKAGT